MSDNKILLGLFKNDTDIRPTITLGQLRWFLNEICRSVPDDVPIIIHDKVTKQCVEVVVTEENVEFL